MMLSGNRVSFIRDEESPNTNEHHAPGNRGFYALRRRNRQCHRKQTAPKVRGNGEKVG